MIRCVSSKGRHFSDEEEEEENEEEEEEEEEAHETDFERVMRLTPDGARDSEVSEERERTPLSILRLGACVTGKRQPSR